MKPHGITERCLLLAFLGVIICSFTFAGPGGGEAATDEPVTLEMWTGWTKDHYMRKVFDEGMDVFMEKNPMIKIEHNVVGWGELQKKAVAGIAAGDVPNAVWGWDPLAFYGSSVDLKPIMDADPTFDKSIIYDVAWDYATVGDEIIALPCVLAPQLLFYNPTRFAEVGLDGPPRTIADIENYTRRLAEKDASGKLTKLGYWPGLEVTLWGNAREFIWPLLFGADWYDEENNRFTFVNDETIECVNWIRSFSKALGPEEIKRYIETYKSAGLSNIDGGTGPFYDGGVGMWISAPWMLRIRELDPTTTVTVAPIPTTEKGGSPTSGCVWWVPKGAKNMDQTWTFLKYLAGEEWQIRYSGPGADPLPPTNKVAVAELAQLPELDWLQLLVSQKVFETALVPPRSTVYGKVSVEYRDRIEDLFYNFDVPVERVLQEIEDRANDYLAQQ